MLSEEIIVTRTEELYKKIRPVMVTMGCCMDPHQAYMVLRGVKTLSIRIERAQQNACKLPGSSRITLK